MKGVRGKGISSFFRVSSSPLCHTPTLAPHLWRHCVPFGARFPALSLPSVPRRELWQVIASDERKMPSQRGRKAKTAASDGATVWVPKATISTSAQQQRPSSQAAVAEPMTETAYPAKKGQTKVKSEVRATFYPKFENEKSDQEIRSRMIEVVASGRGVVEVTLKHSGSLFMYAGDGQAFAKNSYGNLYTAVGVYVLGKTLEQAWGDQAKAKQREFNAYLKEHRISISMELVTAVLGDHGQRPLKDYVVVTAVTELTGRPRFFSTPDLVEFCRKWRLPTNEVWLFSTRKSASTCFAAYDVLCEQSIYTLVRDNFNKIADATVPGTESHAVVQGEILEGLVARIVSFESGKKLKLVAEKYPVPDHAPGAYTAPGLREICMANRQSEKEQSKALLKAVGTDFCSDWNAWFDKENDATQTAWLNKFLQTPPADDPTAKLQEMVNLLRQKNMRVRFKCQSRQGSENEFTMTIHVLQDSVFRRYQKEMQYNPSLWPLYRGFFVDVMLTKDSQNNSSSSNETEEVTLGHLDQDAMADDAEHLMVKLKFLTYKIRTFLIRNGIDILFNKGKQGYKDYYFRQMQIWGTSAEKQRELSRMLDEWASHITQKIKIGKLKEGSYLSEAEPFLKAFASRSTKNQLLVGQAGTDIDTAAYLAASREGDDEEGDLKQDVGASPDVPISREGIKAKGLLVFFPGIPGCAKSALCKEIISTPGGIGDKRPMKSLMGDMIKGRYWPKLEEERKKNPNVITLADKNAPTADVWKLVTDICKSTDAIAVPIVPDSEGTDSNPFSLDALAVFIFRVLHREQHPGNLDKNSPYPGYVLMMFYNLYDGMDRSEFDAELHKRFGYLIKFPLLKPNRPPLPGPLKAVLDEGLELFRKHAAKHGKADPSKGSFKGEWDAWEKKLKDTMLAHSAHINGIQVPFEDVVKSVREKLRDVVTGNVQVHMPDTQERKFRAFNYAAVSLPVDGILSALAKVSSADAGAKAFLAPKNLSNTLRAGHVTLAHVRSHGAAAVAEYGAYVGTEVPVKFTAFLYCPRMCAFEAHLDSKSVASKNPMPHVTLWTAPGTPPKEAGSLGKLAAEGQATRVVLRQPIVVTGKVEFKM
ncbi:tRNA ligase 1 [Selaginella moellendorffii]|nr:tRNA ligase 1 [Selaginella moellendorffii]|eukprot:XP_002993571.2 tRNA ligase 1 [Selaginella moellendorffii]